MSRKSQKNNSFFILIILLLGCFLLPGNSQAAVRKEFNYQGKLTNVNGLAVSDGAYDVTFKIYTQAGGGTAAWTESWTSATLFTDAGTTVAADGCAAGINKISYTSDTNESSLVAGQTLWNTAKKQSAVIESVVAASNYICVYSPASAWANGDTVTNRVYVKNGLFSVMVGSVATLTPPDFIGGTYYLGVTVGSDSEMIPRKKIGSVPQAWNANNLSGDGIIDIDNTSVAHDAGNIYYNPASGNYNALSIAYGTAGGTGTALSVTQSGTGAIVSLANTASATADAFALTNLGSGKSFIVNDEAADTTPFVIDAAGNVGIGTTSPAYKLDVNGQARLQSTANLDLSAFGSDSTIYIRSAHYSNNNKFFSWDDGLTDVDDTANGASLGYVARFTAGWTGYSYVNRSTGFAPGTYDVYVRARSDGTGNHPTSVSFGVYDNTTASFPMLPTFVSLPVSTVYQEVYAGRVAITTDMLDDNTATFFSEGGTTTNYFVDYVKFVKAPLFVGGNVGIGTTTPSQKLDIAGNININTNGTSILFSTYKGANSDGGNIWIGGGGQSSVGEVGATDKGSNNTANGFSSLYSNTTGQYNTARRHNKIKLPLLQHHRTIQHRKWS
ncbi:MAG: hypothetical protein WCQ96_01800 [Patescibacteria group bacterium]